jgi:hypothetical protein
MNIIIFLLFFILLLKIGEIFLFKSDPKTPLPFTIDTLNEFIRKETSFEILKWMMESRFQRNANTGDPIFVKQITNSDETKKRVAIITNIIVEKISPDFQKIYNIYYKKEAQKIDRKTIVNISLREYIARYVFFIFRKLTYDITIMINSDEYKSTKLDEILNQYILSLERTIYQDNHIYLISSEQNNVE